MIGNATSKIVFFFPPVECSSVVNASLPCYVLLEGDILQIKGIFPNINDQWFMVLMRRHSNSTLKNVEDLLLRSRSDFPHSFYQYCKANKTLIATNVQLMLPCLFSLQCIHTACYLLEKFAVHSTCEQTSITKATTRISPSLRTPFLLVAVLQPLHMQVKMLQ